VPDGSGGVSWRVNVSLIAGGVMLAFLGVAAVLGLCFCPAEPPRVCPCGGRVRPKAFLLPWGEGGEVLSLCCAPRRDPHRSIAVAAEEMASIEEPNWICSGCSRTWKHHQVDCRNLPAAPLERWVRRLLPR
jgi:hypothetical protein